jgi:hypothetical protein
MSRYSELRDQHALWVSRYDRWQERCHAFLWQFTRGFAEYLGAPAHEIFAFGAPANLVDIYKAVILSSGERTWERAEHPEEFAWDADAGFFEFILGVSIVHSQAANHTLFVKCFFRTTGDGFELRIGPDGTVQRVADSGPNLLQPAYEALFELLREHANSDPGRAPDDRDPIGFALT